MRMHRRPHVSSDPAAHHSLHATLTPPPRGSGQWMGSCLSRDARLPNCVASDADLIIKLTAKQTVGAFAGRLA
ncbi:MAG: hypothetical protein EBT47_06500 [Chloroflexi bacterium]|nr:hypothetical protein [Chloroflexota bacterium]